MGLDYNIIGNKTKRYFKSDFEGGNSVYGIDLMSVTFNKDIYTMCVPTVVTADYIGRPDLLSLAKYGTDKYADIICKINGISNPFEMNENDIVYMPQVDDLPAYINSKFIYSEMDDDFASDDTVLQKETIGNQKLKNQKRTPAEQTIGDSNYIVDRTNSLVYY